MKILILLPFLFVFTSCVKSFEEKIADNIEEKFKNDGDCTVNIKSLTDFDWDSMYVFSLGNEDDFYKVLKIDKRDPIMEFSRKIVFMKGRKEVLLDIEESDIENVSEGEVVFPIPDSVNYAIFTPGNAIFSASVRHQGGRKYYQLWSLPDSIKH